MTQANAIVLVLKVGCIAGFCSLVLWIAVYSKLAPWWRNPIGRTLVTKTALIALLLVPSTLSLFFHFNRLTSYVAGWIDAVLICLITPAMLWRTAVWIRASRGKASRQGGSEC